MSNRAVAEDILTAYALNRELVKVADEVDQTIAEYRTRALEYADIKADSELAQASAYPQTTGTVDERKAAVTRACIEAIRSEYRAEALRNSADRAVKASMARLSALQSMAAALREELRLGRVGAGYDT